MLKNKIKYDYKIIICIILFFIISLISLSCAQKLVPDIEYLVVKQLLWYIIGFISIIFILFIKNDIIIKYAWILYILGNISLVLVLFFGTSINNAKCWFKISNIGNFQPSEFMKIILIILLSKLIDNFNKDNNSHTLFDEFKFLLFIIFIVGIPSILTFLEPDTGVVLIYLIITIIMLFIGCIRYRWFILLILICISGITALLFIYFTNNNLFINIFDSSFFLRIDRLLDWSNSSGYQLEYGYTAIGSGGLFGYGINNVQIYYPEPQTDFIFATISNSFGFIGSSLLILLIIYFDIRLIKLANKSNNINSYIISGCIGMLIYQQFQNIGMTLGIMPITGITLPFISYGGSSLISYMIIIGIILNTTKINKINK